MIGEFEYGSLINGCKEIGECCVEGSVCAKCLRKLYTTSALVVSVNIVAVSHILAVLLSKDDKEDFTIDWPVDVTYSVTDHTNVCV